MRDQQNTDASMKHGRKPPETMKVFGPFVVHRLINQRRQARDGELHDTPSQLPGSTHENTHHKEISMNNTELDIARSQIIAARDYTRALLDHTPASLWLEIPDGTCSSIAWQVGHLAMAQFRLCIYYVREITAQDRNVISDEFMAHFRKGTNAKAKHASFPSTDEIRRRFDGTHQHILDSWSQYEQMDMKQNARCHPHRIIEKRMDALFWMARHEMIHAGQIGMLRRMLGCESMW